MKQPCCGLCGKTDNLTKTPCCDHWVCDESNESSFPYGANNCYRNHERYTLCAAHYNEDHQGNWQACQLCKDDYAIEDYVEYATNAFNFEPLKNLPEITIKCANCDFKSSIMQDFFLQTSKGWYCTKSQCQERVMTLLIEQN
ncbi:MAG: hypothetical protein GY821_03440 [Gammaproteobacteria bacterium]|nr:hypothetical protein [Gammaproteobacteria bacterium]